VECVTACLCPACTDTPAPTYTEAHRHACEVQMVVDMYGKAERTKYLVLVREHRGIDAAKRLRNDAIVAWKRQQI
jgi:hypothetical protein